MTRLQASRPREGCPRAAAPRLRPSRFAAVALAWAVVLAAGAARGGETPWPGIRDGLVLAWPCANRPGEVVDPETGARRLLRMELRGSARFGRFFEMDPRGGYFVAAGADDAVAAACKKTHQVTLEAMMTPADLQQAGPAAIIACGPAPDKGNFLLGQEGDRLVLRLRTSAASPAQPLTLARLEAGRPQHILVAYQPGRIACYRDGEPAAPAGAVSGDLAPWTPQTLAFGADPAGGSPWAGTLEGIAIYNRFVGPDEAKIRFAAAAARLKDRKTAERVVVEARLRTVTPTPAPEAVAPYVRAMAAHEYEVEKVLQGRCDAKGILAAHWVILDARILPAAWRVGDRYRLVLERFEDHPELESERLLMGKVKADLPLYFDLER